MEGKRRVSDIANPLVLTLRDRDIPSKHRRRLPPDRRADGRMARAGRDHATQPSED